ncbi:hypothetical protein ABZ733_38630, partial [Streptomyces longwoodensis]|uniref:hypothetical protein n=1 Tax=Streptomyces longwoodensis TaxID=68231 RepID=UPI0033E051CF
LTDSVNGKKNDGKAKETVQVVDVAQLLLDSVRTRTPVGRQGGEPPAGAAQEQGEPQPRHQPVE